MPPPRRAPTRCSASWRRRTARCWARDGRAAAAVRASRAARSRCCRFIYTTAAIPTGCPLAYAWSTLLKRDLARDPRAARPGAAGQPVVRSGARHAGGHARRTAAAHAKRGGRVPWHFLTTRSVPELLPLLDGFGQDVRGRADAQGAATRPHPRAQGVPDRPATAWCARSTPPRSCSRRSCSTTSRRC